MNYKQLIIDMVESMKDSESLELIYTCAKVLYDYENDPEGIEENGLDW